MRTKLIFLSAVFIIFFIYFSFTVAKEKWTQFDFDTTVKLQDNISRKFDEYFSYFSLLGSVEITIGFCVIMALLSLIRLKPLSFLGWLLIIPATFAELFGKLVLFHPAPPNFFHRSIIAADFPSFYVHTDFSYPSGHMTRTIFIITIFISMVIFSSKSLLLRLINGCILIFLAILMGMTRIYLGEHWLSDVVGGAALGACMGFFASGLILKSGKDNIAADARGR